MKNPIVQVIKRCTLLSMLAFASATSAQTVVNVMINQPQKLDIVANELITQKMDTLVLGESVSITGGVSPYKYAWLKGSQPVGTSLVVKLPGVILSNDYSLNVTDANNCTCSKNSNQTGISDKESRSSVIAVYPNPTSGTITINTEKAELLYISIFDYKGVAVLNTHMNGRTNLDLNLPSGLYYLKIENKDRTVVESKKLMIL